MINKEQVKEDDMKADWRAGNYPKKEYGLVTIRHLNDQDYKEKAKQRIKEYRKKYMKDYYLRVIKPKQ